MRVLLAPSPSRVAGRYCCDALGLLARVDTLTDVVMLSLAYWGGDVQDWVGHHNFVSQERAARAGYATPKCVLSVVRPNHRRLGRHALDAALLQVFEQRPDIVIAVEPRAEANRVIEVADSRGVPALVGVVRRGTVEWRRVPRVQLPRRSGTESEGSDTLYGTAKASASVDHQRMIENTRRGGGVRRSGTRTVADPV